MLILFVKVCHAHLFRRDLEKATQLNSDDTFFCQPFHRRASAN